MRNAIIYSITDRLAQAGRWSTCRLSGLIFSYVIVLLLAELPLAAQDSGDLPDYRGREFWLCFPPNVHISKTLKYDSLFIFISANKATRVRIDYRAWQPGSSDYEVYSDEFHVETNQIYSYALPFRRQISERTFEYLELQDESQNESIAGQSFHIRSDEDIALYGMNRANTSTDAFMAMPTDALGRDYIILSYNSHDIDGSVGTPSQFAIVATEDDTEVSIQPSAPTKSEQGDRSLLLDKGEVYLVQAKVGSIPGIGFENDLSGSRVKSSRPVAVFAGHKRALVPIERSDTLLSRDHLIQQLLPVSTWGRRAFVTPFAEARNEQKLSGDIFRIVAAVDNTEVRIADDEIFLDAGEVFEDTLTDEAKAISASGPILVAQYRKSTNVENTRNDGRVADPFMVLVPPVEQYLNQYLLVNAQTYEDDRAIYEFHYLTIVAPKEARSTIRLQPPPLDDIRWTDIPGSDFAYAHALVESGVHELSAAANISVIAYGYGHADSYGYPGGLLLEPILAPAFDTTSACLRLSGIASDTSGSRNAVTAIEAPEELRTNVNVRILNPNGAGDTVRFEAELQNPYNDGAFTLLSTFAELYDSERSYHIPGFTVHVDADIRDERRVEVEDSVLVNRKRCFSYRLQNYGRFPQVIDSLVWTEAMPAFEIRPDFDLPLKLEPGESRSFQLCFESAEAGQVRSSLAIQGRCLRRTLLDFNLRSIVDAEAPRVTREGNACDELLILSFSEGPGMVAGIQSASLLAVNCDVQIREERLPERLSFEARIRDPRRDAIIHIDVVDSVGNLRALRDTIGGFTLGALGIAGKPIDFGSGSYGSLRCDSVILFNYGIRSLPLQRLRVNDNRQFSLPLAGRPAFINPGDTLSLRVCFHPERSGVFSDTVIVSGACADLRLPLLGEAQQPLLSANSNCGIAISTGAGEAGGAAFLEQHYPQPAGDQVKLDFGLPTSAAVNLRIFDALGLELARFVHTVEAGVYQMALDVSRLKNGIYFYEFRAGQWYELRKLLVLR